VRPRRPRVRNLSGVVALLTLFAWVGSAGAEIPDAESDAASVVTAISAWQGADGATVVEVKADAPFPPGSLRHSHMFGELPREVLRIRGITTRYRPYTTLVGDGNVHRIRVGHHPEFAPPELHLVFDLVSDAVVISGMVREGNRLLLYLSGPPSAPTPRAPPPTPTPTPTLRPTLRPTWTPTPTQTPSPAGTPSPRATSLVPVATDAPVEPVATVPPAGTMTSPPPAARSSRYRVWGDGRPSARERPGYSVRQTPARVVTEIVTSDRGDGSSLLRISADGSFSEGSFRYLETATDPLRDVLLIRGVEISKSPLLLDIKDPNVKQLELTIDRESRPPYLRVEIRFNSPGVRAERVTAQGRHLVVLFSRR